MTDLDELLARIDTVIAEASLPLPSPQVSTPDELAEPHITAGQTPVAEPPPAQDWLKVETAPPSWWRRILRRPQ